MKYMPYFLKINSYVILHTHPHHFILKYNIYICMCELTHFLKFGWLLLKLILKLLSLYLPNITCKSVSWGLNEAFPIITLGRYRKSILGQIVLRFLTYSVYSGVPETEKNNFWIPHPAEYCILIYSDITYIKPDIILK